MRCCGLHPTFKAGDMTFRIIFAMCFSLHSDIQNRIPTLAWPDNKVLIVLQYPDTEIIGQLSTAILTQYI